MEFEEAGALRKNSNRAIAELEEHVTLAIGSDGFLDMVVEPDGADEFASMEVNFLFDEPDEPKVLRAMPEEEDGVSRLCQDKAT
ncbi:hypothetical protein HDV00_007087 [Rhizophlyctis rosea]|nr:hypothetical protein HDV00_007087 [Rhizophlyctis rosea]